MKRSVYRACEALHQWCRGEAPRRTYAEAREMVPPPGEELSNPIERRARALIALVPADSRRQAIRRCAKLAGGLTLREVRIWAGSP
jgi:hypothetical protein